MHYASYWGHSEVVDRLLTQAARVQGGQAAAVNAADAGGTTPLMLAAQRGHMAVVGQLLQVPQIQLNAQDFGGWTALHAAASAGHLGVLKQLLSTPGIAINAVSNTGISALHDACAEGRLPVVAMLLEACADACCQDEEGATPL
jgi:ankyrin repeat protein